ncbi:MAG: hypothetical protein ACE5NW_13930 [Acidiferrobacterales bacterium]
MATSHGLHRKITHGIHGNPWGRQLRALAEQMRVTLREVLATTGVGAECRRQRQPLSIGLGAWRIEPNTDIGVFTGKRSPPPSLVGSTYVRQRRVSDAFRFGPLCRHR